MVWNDWRNGANSGQRFKGWPGAKPHFNTGLYANDFKGKGNGGGKRDNGGGGGSSQDQLNLRTAKSTMSIVRKKFGAFYKRFKKSGKTHKLPIAKALRFLYKRGSETSASELAEDKE